MKGHNMKFMINVPDGMVAIDGKKTSEVSMEDIHPSILKIHWYGSFGDEHFSDNDTIKVRRFFDITPYLPILETAEALITEQLSASEPVITYIELRAAEYPDVRDYLDGIVKGDQIQIDTYIEKCRQIKLKYPKPESELISI